MAAVSESKETVPGETVGDELFVGSKCRFYLLSFAEQTVTDEYHQLMAALVPSLKPSTVTQEQVLAPCPLKFDVNQRRTAQLCQHDRKGHNQKSTLAHQAALQPQPAIHAEEIPGIGTRQSRTSKRKMCGSDVEAVCGYEKRSM